MTGASGHRVPLAEASLGRLAEERGDITAEVLERYYAAEPGARASFAHHGLGDTSGLEARMVAETVFLLLRWVEEPAAVMIEQGTTIVHHNDTLEVGPRWYMGLVDATLEVLLENIPAACEAERAMWREVCCEIARFVESLRAEFLRTVDLRSLPSPA
ncbi:hypothetical protein ACWPM1_06725 [Tsuneonella sp. HG249]